MFTDDTTIENHINAKRQHNLALQRDTYVLMAITLGLALLFASLALIYPGLAAFLASHWYIAIGLAVLAVILILLSYFSPALRKAPINMVIYALFTVCFVYLVGFAASSNFWRYVYFALWILFLIVLGYLLYAHATSTAVSALVSFAIVFSAAMIVFFVFLIFTKMGFLPLVFVMLGTMVYGYYLGHNVRTNARGTLLDPTTDDPFTGAVRSWLEGFLVFFRFIEMLGYGCCKHKSAI